VRSHPDGAAAGELGRALRLQRDQRHPGNAHRDDHRALHRRAAVDEVPSHGEDERHREDDQCSGDAEPLAVSGRRGVAVDRADRDRGDHDQAERVQRCSLASKPLLGARVCLGLAGALRPVHGQTIERRPARRNGPATPTMARRADHAVASRRPRI
jgi:hypothetical protein